MSAAAGTVCPACQVTETSPSGDPDSWCAECAVVRDQGTSRELAALLYRHLLPRPSTYTEDWWLWQEGPEQDYEEDYSGKWLVFVPTGHVDDWWGLLRIGVERGHLGTGAKVATAAPSSAEISPNTRVICIYTYDYRDHDDVRRVLAGLRKARVNWRLSYKTDRATLDARYGRGTATYVSQAGTGHFEDRRAPGEHATASTAGA